MLSIKTEGANISSSLINIIFLSSVSKHTCKN